MACCWATNTPGFRTCFVPPTTPGTHTITAVATEGHLFPGGATTQDFTYTILAQLDPLLTECLDPADPAATALVPVC